MNTTRRQRIERPFWIVVYLLSPIIPISFYFAGNWFSFFHSWSLSITLGIVAYVWYLNQFIVAARPRYWDRLYGLDRMYRFHGTMAIVSTLVVIGHIVLKRLTFPVISTQQVFGAAAVLIFVIVIVGTIVFMVESKVSRLQPLKRLKRYAAERWRWQYHHLKRFHNLVVFAAILVLVHVLLAFSTRESLSRIAVMIAWLVVTLGLYSWHKVIQPMREKRAPWEVTEVVEENGTVTTVHLSIPEGREFSYKPGQFVYLRFLDGVPGAEEHPFTLSSSPKDSSISITAKDLGDFSGRLKEVSLGAAALIDGPYGVFRSDRVDPQRPLVFVAGGIGITPFLSMLGSFASSEEPTRRPLHLLWSIRHESDMCLLERLQEYAEMLPGLGIEIFVSRGTGDRSGLNVPERFAVSSGRISVDEMVARGLVGTGREFFVCGPQAMMESIVGDLRSHGIPGKQIHYEAFAM